MYEHSISAKLFPGIKTNGTPGNVEYSCNRQMEKETLFCSRIPQKTSTPAKHKRSRSNM